jgi:hypothetical protein
LIDTLHRVAITSWTPGSRGSGRVREFFDEARLKPMSSR